ncbi:NUDIX hydrolase [Sinomicrobium pectinilyticum]|uniref:NUDIX domain-containing protein n=1 Tax=Sinomicrobium pectinilyticum TaxID=1084421 RepID=A0A3N0DQW3_SINP1|nr:NUDIX domain-containing protein [Sinomicrobium pectinilyticum]RNL78030.1 NUDIX domain-containing protein [Sinomicrobium pectinilyticum]
MGNDIALPTTGLIVVRDHKLLLAYSNNKNAWYLPGGKVDKGETSLQSLIREIREELNIEIIPEKLSYYCHISAPAYGENTSVIMEQDCFFYELTGEVKPGNEIGAVKFFNLEMYTSEPVQVIGVLKVFEKLAKDNILI